MKEEREKTDTRNSKMVGINPSYKKLSHVSQLLSSTTPWLAQQRHEWSDPVAV